MNEDKLIFTLKVLKKFINNALELNYKKQEVTGYELLSPILKSTACNTYIETVSDKADTLYLRIKESLISTIEYSYLHNLKNISEKFKLNEKKVILAFDYTDEDFYGEVQGFDIPGWTGKDGVKGKFKFPTYSIISD